MAGTDLSGAVLDDRYQIIEPIAEGAMGAVYRGERLKLGRAVAIKIMHDALPDELASRQRFEREAKLMALLEHPHCVSVMDFGLHEGKPYLVMELVRGTSLLEVLTRAGRIEPARAIEITRQILSGLAHAHELGIVHRDIKPANVMLTERTGLGEQVRILDFGLARPATDSTKLTTGIVVGTPNYMAPEQIKGGAIDGRTDLYAVGVMLFELLTGQKPFIADDPLAVVRKHLNMKPPTLADILPNVGFGALEEVVARALAKAPAHRYENAAEMSAALDQALARRAGTAELMARAVPQFSTEGATGPRPGGPPSAKVATASGWNLPGDPSLARPGGPEIPVIGAPSSRPIPAPYGAPTSGPIPAPYGAPTSGPIPAPYGAPTSGPIPAPHGAPTSGPIPAPYGAPTSGPIPAPHGAPNSGPTAAPYGAPNSGPTAAPHGAPNSGPIAALHGAPNSGPTAAPYGAPNSGPTAAPYGAPNSGPIAAPYGAPSSGPIAAYGAGGTGSDPGAGANAADSLAATALALGTVAPGQRAASEPGAAPGDGRTAHRAGPARVPDPSVPATRMLPLRGLPVTRTQLAIGGGALLLVIAIVAARHGGTSQHSATPATGSAHAVADAVPGDPVAPVLARASDLYANGDLEPALDIVHRARRDHPDSAQLAYLDGKLYFAKLWWTDGVKAFRDAIRLDPGYRTDTELIKVVLKGFLTTPDTDSRIEEFIREDLGAAARPALEETAQSHPNAALRARAASELRRLDAASKP